MGLSMTTIITTIDYCMDECDDYEYKNYKSKKETTKALRIKRDKVNRNYKKNYGSDIRKNSVDEIINRHCRCAEFECECLNSSPSGWGFLPIDIDD